MKHYTTRLCILIILVLFSTFPFNISYGASNDIIESFAWLGLGTDKVGTFGQDEGVPNGTPDGHFRLNLNFPQENELIHIALYLANSAGIPYGGVIWHTHPPRWWILGVFQQGEQINSSHVALLGKFNGPVEFDLYANDSGHFVAGNYFKVEVKLGDGRYFNKLLLIPEGTGCVKYNNQIKVRRNELLQFLCKFPLFPEPNIIAMFVIPKEIVQLSRDAHKSALDYYKLSCDALDRAESFSNLNDCDNVKNYISLSDKYMKIGVMQYNASYSLLVNALDIGTYNLALKSIGATVSIGGGPLLGALVTAINLYNNFYVDMVATDKETATKNAITTIVIEVITLKLGVGEEVQKVWGQGAYGALKQVADSGEIQEEVLKRFMAGFGKTLGYTYPDAQKIIAKYLGTMDWFASEGVQKNYCFGYTDVGTKSILDINSYNGNWFGTYFCPQGITGLLLQLKPVSNNRLEGVFNFFPIAQNQNVPKGSFKVNGVLYKDGKLFIRGGQWIQRPPNYMAVNLEGRISPDLKKISGRVMTFGCKEFQIMK